MRYAITNLAESLPGASVEAADRRRQRWLADLRRWAAEGVSHVQLREKVLGAGEVFALAQAGMELLESFAPGELSAARPKLLVNSRADLALAAGADGVHLTSGEGELQPAQVKELARQSGRSEWLVSVSCHEVAQVAAARQRGADLVLFGPVFGKSVGGVPVLQPTGLEALRRAIAAAGEMPVLALGGVTAEAAGVCGEMGAAGIAGIRLFAGRP